MHGDCRRDRDDNFLLIATVAKCYYHVIGGRTNAGWRIGNLMVKSIDLGRGSGCSAANTIDFLLNLGKYTVAECIVNFWQHCTVKVTLCHISHIFGNVTL